MVRAAVIFFLLAFAAVIIGAADIAGISLQTGKLILGAFFALSVASFIIAIVAGTKADRPL